MGILLYFMVTGLMPFRAENVGKLKKSILEGHYSIPPHVSDECQQLIRKDLFFLQSFDLIRILNGLANY